MKCPYCKKKMMYFVISKEYFCLNTGCIGYGKFIKKKVDSPVK